MYLRPRMIAIAMTFSFSVVADIKGHDLMIHAGGDSYNDTPKPLGGGGPRATCGVIE